MGRAPGDRGLFADGGTLMTSRPSASRTDSVGMWRSLLVVS